MFPGPVGMGHASRLFAHNDYGACPTILQCPDTLWGVLQRSYEHSKTLEFSQDAGRSPVIDLDEVCLAR